MVTKKVVKVKPQEKSVDTCKCGHSKSNMKKEKESCCQQKKGCC